MGSGGDVEVDFDDVVEVDSEDVVEVGSEDVVEVGSGSAEHVFVEAGSRHSRGVILMLLY